MHTRKSILLFGHGDGGGGPATSHLEQLARIQHCKSMPNIYLNVDPESFFKMLDDDFKHVSSQYKIPSPKWVGELYLELHQGTLTSQGLIKWQNRRAEEIMRTVDALIVYYYNLLLSKNVRQNEKILRFRETAKKLWKDTLLNQFHDVIRN